MVCVFTRGTSEPLASLVKQIDSKIGEEKKLKSFMVVIPKKDDQPAESLRKFAKDHGVKHIPLTIGEAPDGPSDYSISADADVTVIMWKDGEVRFNHGFKGTLNDKDIEKITADIPRLLEK